MYLRNLILVASMMIGMTVSTKTAAADVEITYTYDGHIYVDGNESDFEFSISWNDIVTKSLTALGGSISKAEFENNWIFDGDNGDESILTQYSDNHTTLSQPIGSVIFYTGDYKGVQWRIDANSLMNVISQGEVDRNTGLFTSPITTYLKLQGSPNVWVKLTIPAGQIHVATDIGIAVNATNFPDEAFRNWVLQNISGASDGWLTDSEIAKIKSINCSGTNEKKGSIVSLQGIEYFTVLTTLNCEFNKLTRLDVSNNTALTELSCYSNQLTSLDVSNNTALTHLECDFNQLTSLDVSKNTALTFLYCGSNLLTSLDVSYNTALTDLNCASNQLTSLDVSKNTALTSLDCYSNLLTILNVSKNTALVQLYCGANRLVSLDVSNNTTLTELNCESNQLTSLDVSKNTALNFLYCPSNRLTSLDVSKNTALTWMECSSNRLTSLDVSMNTALTVLICFANQLKSLDVSKNAKLEGLRCQHNQLTSLDVSKNSALYDLWCNSNELMCLDLSGNTSIKTASIGKQSKSLMAVSTSADIAIPIPSDFDFTKVSDLKLDGASVSGSVTNVNGQNYLVFAQTGTEQSSIDGKNLTYQYNTGNKLRDARSMNVTVYLAYTPKTYTLSIQSGSGGSVSYDGTTITNTTKSFSIAEGASATISISPNSGYKLSKLTVNGTNVTSSVSNNQYTISNITANTAVVATFEQITYTLSVQATGSGTVAYNSTSVKNTTRTFTVNHGTSATLTITPDAGYRLASLTVNGTNVTTNVSNGKYTISNITANTNVIATFEQITYNLNVQASGNGSITYDGTSVKNGTHSFTVNYGASATMTLKPDDGFRLASLAVNGTDVTEKVSNNQYTISNITATTTVVATFEQIPVTYYTLSIQSGSGGSVSYNGITITNDTKTYTVAEGVSATITITPDSGYRLSKVTVNETDVTSKVSDNQYTVSNITANTTVSVTFEEIPPVTYTLSISATGNGSASYSGETIRSGSKSFTLNEGANATITFTPDNGYRIANVKVNGSDVTNKVANNQYTISSISANTTVAVTFEAIPPTTYQLTISASGNGEVSYSGETIRNGNKSFTLNEGTNATITFSPDNGYRIANVIVNNTDVTNKVANNQYTVSGIQANTSVSVTFEEIPPTTYMLSIMASGNGSVAYDGTTVRNQTHSFTINEGSFATLLLSPDDGYHVASIIVNSVDVTSAIEDNQYTVSNIKANTVVSVSFEEIPPTTYTLSITASGNGSIVYDGTTARNQTRTFTLVEGSSAVLTFTPDNGHRVASAKVNGSDVTAQITNHQYTINNISANTSVEATFAEIEYTSIDHEGLNYRVVSNSNKTVSVAKGNYGYYITVPESFTENYFDWTVTGMDDDVLSSNPQLAAVIWNPSTLFTGSVDNPNFLLYVKSSQYAPSSIKNVVVNGTANNITLTDAANGNNFYCPQEFTAKQINYTHYYSMTTGIETAQGWESIALPFDVQSITHPSKGTLVPFANWRSGSSERPFWLYQLSGNGFVVANSIQANRPYIISLPNNSEYREEYRVNGVITFSAIDATVKSSENLQTGSYSDRTFIPNFINQNASNGFYVLNAINNYSTNAGGYTEGSRFVRNLRAVHPFEAYIASANNAKESFPIFEDETTWIRSLSHIPSPEGEGGVYNLSGQQIRLDENQSTKNLKKGVYIVDGKKIVIR